MIQRIFHYTSFETLKEIIENRTIRFNSLLYVDDKYEAITRDFGSLQAYYFSSCWTYDEPENEDLWKSYVKNDFGVRISASPDFLKPIRDNNDEIKNHTHNEAVCRLIHRGKKGNTFLEKIQYREGYNKGNIPQMTKSLRGLISEDFIENFGLLKDLEKWGWQKEVRFSIQAVSDKIIEKNMTEYGVASRYNAFVEAIDNDDPTGIEFIDVEFDEKQLEKFDFLAGPKATDEEFQQVTQYIQQKIPDFRGALSRSALSPMAR